MMKKWNLKVVGQAFLIQFLFFFMLLIFGPAEIFFANYDEFSFLYGDFAGFLACIALFLSVIFTVLVMILPEKLGRVLTAVVFGGAVSAGNVFK
jgi:hypothetical protein